MRKTWIGLALATVMAFPLAAQTRDQVKAFVKQAVEFAKKNPKDKFLEEVSGTKGRFHFSKGQNNDLYIFVYDSEGKVVAHGARRELVGVNRWTTKDPDGKLFVQEFAGVAKGKAAAWVEYKELNPAQNNKVMKKASWVEPFDGLAIGAGIYE